MTQEKDIDIVKTMIQMFCKRKHHCKHSLCPDCEALLLYVEERRAKCPFGDQKTFCSNCKIHCYKPDMRTKIKEVMAYSGPLLIFTHPIITIKHFNETRKMKKERKKHEKQTTE